jgi:hypothetical protein
LKKAHHGDTKDTEKREEKGYGIVFPFFSVFLGVLRISVVSFFVVFFSCCGTRPHPWRPSRGEIIIY